MVVENWKQAYIGVISKVAQDVQSIAADLDGDGLYVNAKLSDKITAALHEHEFVEQSDGSTTFYVDPDAPDRGVMMSDDPDDQSTFVWAFFQH